MLVIVQNFMIKKFIFLLLIASAATSCSDSNSFDIGKDNVGPLTRDTEVSELENLFASDSLVDESGNGEFSSPIGDVTIYEKGGKKLLQLSPASPDRDSKIKFIQILDPRYKTAKGIGLKSTFKDIEQAYKIKRIDNLIGTIVIFVEDGDEYFTIDKKHLSSNMMFDTDSKIEASQIPGEASIKYLMIGW